MKNYLNISIYVKCCPEKLSCALYMSFDTNILNIICKYVDDAKTYFNFALVCRKTRYVTKLHKNNKMDEFVIKYVEPDGDGQLVKRRLPNGKSHDVTAVQYFEFINLDDMRQMYYNGICLASWFTHKLNRLGKRVNITHYKCDCTKDFENSYTNDKIGLDGVRYYYKVI